MKKKFLLLLATLLLSLAIVPAAFATGEGDGSGETTPAPQEYAAVVLDAEGQTVGQYETVQKAVNASQEGQTVKLLKDSEENVSFNNKKGITVDGLAADGKTKYSINRMVFNGGKNNYNEAIILKNIKFTPKDAFAININSSSDNPEKKFNNNITIENCDFTLDEGSLAWVFILVQKQAENVKILNNTFTIEREDGHTRDDKKPESEWDPFKCINFLHTPDRVTSTTLIQGNTVTSKHKKNELYFVNGDIGEGTKLTGCTIKGLTIKENIVNSVEDGDMYGVGLASTEDLDVLNNTFNCSVGVDLMTSKGPAANTDITITDNKGTAPTMVALEGEKPVAEGFVTDVTGDQIDNSQAPNTVRVTFDANGGQSEEDSRVLLHAGDAIGTLPTAPKREGSYEFAGWYTSDGVAIDKDTVIDADTTLVAHWNYTGPTGPAVYAIAVADADHGSVAVDPHKAVKGKTVTITATPDAGYEVDAVSVTDRNGKAIQFTENSDGTFSFTMPASKVDISVSFKAASVEPEPQPTPENPFTDVADGDYYYDAVLWAVDNKITNGTSATTFGPTLACTRAQMICFLWNQAGQPDPTSEEMPFTDVAEGSYYHDAVQWAVENGLAAGTSSTTFSPNATLSRAQTVTFLYRAAGEPAVNADSSFADVADGAYYADAVAWAVQNGVTNGINANTFSPDADCSRGQIVTFLYRAAE